MEQVYKQRKTTVMTSMELKGSIKAPGWTLNQPLGNTFVPPAEADDWCELRERMH